MDVEILPWISYSKQGGFWYNLIQIRCLIYLKLLYFLCDGQVGFSVVVVGVCLSAAIRYITVDST